MTGELRLARLLPDDPVTGKARIWIEHADPEIEISDELMDELMAGNLVPEVTFRGEVLRIEAENQTVVYEITGHRFAACTWTARWPD